MATSSTPSELDLAFIIDATGSMGSYIAAAQTVCSDTFGHDSNYLTVSII